MQLKYHLCIFVVLILERFTAAEPCPPSEKLSPCSCKNVNNDGYVTCTNLQNSQELKEALSGAKGLKMYSLEIVNSNLGHIPGDMFIGTCFEDLKFSYTKITSIGDDENLPFAGLENCLSRLTLKEGFWDYDRPLTTAVPLDHLKKLTYLNCENNVIPKLGNEWFAKGPVTLRDLWIQNSLTKEVGDKVFAQLKNLRSLHFSGNAVTLTRSALPPNPSYLDSLDLSGNQIVDVPSDLFTNLPSLQYLYLDDNGIRELPETTFKSIMKQLYFLFVNSNPLDCSAKMKWVFINNLQEKIVGTCATPKNLSGKDIDTLTSDDI